MNREYPPSFTAPSGVGIWGRGPTTSNGRHCKRKSTAEGKRDYSQEATDSRPAWPRILYEEDEKTKVKQHSLNFSDDCSTTTRSDLREPKLHKGSDSPCATGPLSKPPTYDHCQCGTDERPKMSIPNSSCIDACQQSPGKTLQVKGGDQCDREVSVFTCSTEHGPSPERFSGQSLKRLKVTFA
jgi:hypothetical protein